MRSILFLLCLILLSLPALSIEPSVKIIALFNDKALVTINGDQKLMKKGETLHGVTLLSASGRGAVVRLPKGDEVKLGINQSIQHAFKKAEKSKVTIYADNFGMFRLNGKINGQNTQFLLDTGATFIAMSEVEADRLGLNYETSSKSKIQTASEVVSAWNIKLDNVKVNHISVPNVDAVVLKGDQPRNVLLGMSFLQHVKLQRNGAAMILEQKY